MFWRKPKASEAVFERYTDKARRAVFFSRYFAFQFGSPLIHTEHLLLGIALEEKAELNRFMKSDATFLSLCRQVEAHSLTHGKLSEDVVAALTKDPDVAIALSQSSKYALGYAVEEADLQGSRHIGPEHLVLGLLREKGCLGERMLRQRGANLKRLRKELAARGQAAVESVEDAATEPAASEPGAQKAGTSKPAG